MPLLESLADLEITEHESFNGKLKGLGMILYFYVSHLTQVLALS